jgi:hypothetical protein
VGVLVMSDVDHVAALSRVGHLAQNKACLLGGTAIALFLAATGSATAQNVITTTVGTITTPVPGSTLWAVPIGGTTTVNVNTTDLISIPFGLNSIWIAQAGFGGTQSITIGAGRLVSGVDGILSTATTDTIGIVNNGAIRATFDGIFAQNTVSGDITVSGPGTIDASAGRNGMWLLTPGAVSVGTVAAPIGTVRGALNGVVVTDLGGPINLNLSSSAGVAGYGVWTVGGTGNQAVTATGLTTGLTGQYLNSTSGNVVSDGRGTGTITGTAGQGITIGTGTGTMTVQNYTGGITGTATGAWLVGTTGAANVLNNGAIVGTAVDGVLIGTTTGAINVNSNGPITGVNGVVTVGGATAVNNNGAITGTAGVGVFTTTNVGAQSVNGNGAITGAVLQGIAATSTTGALSIGNQSFNGMITGATNGIQAASGTGNINVATNANVTGTGNIGIFTSTSGNTVNAITAGIVSGGVWGMDTLAQGAGNITNTIAAGATVRGAAIGLVEGTVSGASVTNNAGLITTTADTGAASIPGGLAISAIAGTNTINNSGRVIGGLSTAGVATTFNNTASGVWIPSLANTPAAVTNSINNDGLIDFRTGATVFGGVTTTLTNRAGGIVDLTYGGNGAATSARDSVFIQNFNPLAGSTTRFNVNFTQPNSSGTEGLANDHSSNGLGTADTIVVWYGTGGRANPTAASTVALNVVGGAAPGTSGSIALINAVSGGLADPGLGGAATMIASSRYLLASDPSTGAVVYKLVEDGNGGVYLQWAPNISTTSLSGFGGAFGAAAGAPGASASATAGAAGSSAGVGGVGIGGGPSGGGALGAIGDLAAAGAGVQSGGSTSNDGSSTGSTNPCARQRNITAWGQYEGEHTNFDGNHKGNSNSLTGGIDVDLSTAMGLACNQLAVGFFGLTGSSQTGSATGKTDGENDGVGGYLRASSPSGFYATLLGAMSWSDARLSNAVFASSASKSTESSTVAGSLGYLLRVAPSTTVDFRGFASYNQGDASPFTDTANIAVSRSRDEIVTYGASVGLHQMLNPSLQAFVRAGFKWSDLDSSVTAFGTTLNGTASDTATSIEAGLVGTLGNDVNIGASGFGTFGDGSTGYGAKAHVEIRF